MMKFSNKILITLLLLFCFSCKEKEHNLKAVMPGLPSVELMPRLSIDKDTIGLADSLTATLSITFSPKISDSQKMQYIESLGFYLDTVSNSGYPEKVSNFTYKVMPDVTADTVQIGFVPKILSMDKDTIVKRDFTAAIKLLYRKEGNDTTVQHVFMDKKGYFISIENSNETKK
jgi:hypothetical protein